MSAPYADDCLNEKETVQDNEAPYKMHIHDVKAVGVLILGQTWLHKDIMNLYKANLQCQQHMIPKAFLRFSSSLIHLKSRRPQNTHSIYNSPFKNFFF